MGGVSVRNLQDQQPLWIVCENSVNMLTIIICICLQGNHLEWLGCALYVAGQSLQLENMEGETREGNSVSLTQILRATKLK